MLPLLAALLIQVSGRLVGDDPKGNNLRDGLHTLMAVITFFFVTQLVPDVMSGNALHFIIDLFPGGTIEWTVEPLGLLFALVASGLWIVTSVYGFGYMRGHEEQHQTRFFTCFALALLPLGWPFQPAFSRFAFYEA